MAERRSYDARFQTGFERHQIRHASDRIEAARP